MTFVQLEYFVTACQQGSLAQRVAEQTPGIKQFSLDRWLISNDIGIAWPRDRVPYGPTDKFIRFVRKISRE